MKTLFINPNSSDAITAAMRRHIRRCGWPDELWDVAKVADAPSIIGSAAQHAAAEQRLARDFLWMTAGYDRVVMMSSVDTGYEIARRHFGASAHGFTRGVLGHHRKHDQRLQIVTFDKAMTSLYERAFEATGHAAVLAGWSVIDLLPATVAAKPDTALGELRKICGRLAAESKTGIFVVGAAGPHRPVRPARHPSELVAERDPRCALVRPTGARNIVKSIQSGR